MSAAMSAKRQRYARSQPVAPTRDRPTRAWLCLLIIPAGLVAYANSFNDAFILDDIKHVMANEGIRQLLPITNHLTTRRPMVELSLAINFAVSQYQTWSYHAFNLAVHLLAGLVLFGVIRRTLLREPLRRRFEHDAPWLALAAALLWVVHPLQTQSVTYIIQRGESLMGLFYLLVIYCMVRGVGSSRAWTWYVAAVVACALGMASKAVMITAPIVALLYDRIFLGGSFRQMLRQRWGLYLGLAATWGVLLLCGVAQGVLNPNPPGPAAVGFGYKGITPIEYLLTQPEVILHYLRLGIWPHPLCLDYEWPVEHDLLGIIIPSAVIVVLLAATAWGLWRRSAVAFLGAWFFLILAPTSSFVPIKDVAFEHRMYLPLAAVIVLLVVGGDRLLRLAMSSKALPVGAARGIGAAVVLALVCAASYGTLQRNRDYRSAVAMWSNVVAQHPDNARAQNDLGIALRRAGRVEEAIECYRRAIDVDPEGEAGWSNLGKALAQLGRYDEAIEPYEHSLAIDPDHALVWNSYGVALQRLGRLDEAMQAFRRSLEADDTLALPHRNLATILTNRGRIDEAIAELRRSLELDPNDHEAHYMLASLLEQQGEYHEAIDHYQKALRLKRDYADAGCNLGNVYFKLGDLDRAMAMYEAVLRADPGHVNARLNLGMVLHRQGRLAEAAEALHRVLQIQPDNTQARQLLAAVEAQRQRAADRPQTP
jgi:tetratricopeptide (TPR) repeat protein